MALIITTKIDGGNVTNVVDEALIAQAVEGGQLRLDKILLKCLYDRKSTDRLLGHLQAQVREPEKLAHIQRFVDAMKDAHGAASRNF
ncbi:MAG: hypothetical protein AAGH90_10665 [Pseudomonadota bacterium]